MAFLYFLWIIAPNLAWLSMKRILFLGSSLALVNKGTHHEWLTKLYCV
ncbi:hypothetical protein GMES_2342 [Paraglaciecola mesophila KMM 241]|uniref:Uncharacterized protein n=1 Tax=Paraglaciecola mesophila KMM 241 TaxID=1128912 RepID=K6Z6L6_9ALTE|nr:hypothetical protein GMES_2342 [Paraglaciecola mesophila KMM 241]